MPVVRNKIKNKNKNKSITLRPYSLRNDSDFVVIEAINTLSPPMGSRFDKAAAQQLIDDGFTVTIKPWTGSIKR